ncbi:hypothetical protein [Kitasatospora sp. MAP5-34]|uniref:hypothetical protein n=1 Tax=Kitasatospora sp. MAP5-34 TaxID=3035102 RepID=UPI0024754076|nr:hypothetical protein [Kitasatospora sp. MAP5-34]MDH6578936.1 hypothetical protein [Kitasatospora sp. MAP5-34]
MSSSRPTDGAKPGPPITVSIEGITEPATFSRLPDALAALWEALRVLPLGWTQYEAYRYFFGPGAVERVEAFLERDGELTLSFAMAGRSHAVRVTPERA